MYGPFFFIAQTVIGSYLDILQLSLFPQLAENSTDFVYQQVKATLIGASMFVLAWTMNSRIAVLAMLVLMTLLSYPSLPDRRI